MMKSPLMMLTIIVWFQSPRTGKFESNHAESGTVCCDNIESFNPLERGNSNQIRRTCWPKRRPAFKSFNPLERGNSNQMRRAQPCYPNLGVDPGFQSPRTGKFESNLVGGKYWCFAPVYWGFQSPRTGKFESNAQLRKEWEVGDNGFNPLERGNSNQIRSQAAR